MKIQNEAIAALLQEKKPIVEAGRALSEELEKRGREITDKEFVNKGVKIKGDVYSGSYQTLKEAFGTATTMMVEELMKSQLKDKFEELEAKGNQLRVINEKVSEIVGAEVIPSLGLSEFQYPSNIDLVDDGIEITVEDAVERFKENYRAKK